MKIHYIRVSESNAKVWLTFMCSQCNHSVNKGDRFCRNCGHKLSDMLDEVDMQKAADILTDALRKEPVAPAKTDEADDSNIGSGCTSGAATADPDAVKGWVVTESDVNLRCAICGKSSHENCKHLRKSGACDAKMCTSNPPQYQMCPFRGNGFIPITEA